jgi:hypothetical protein
MPDDLKAAFSATIRIAAQMVTIRRQLKAVDDRLPSPDRNPARFLQALQSVNSIQLFDEMLILEDDEHRLEKLLDAVTSLLMQELRRRFPDKDVRKIGVTPDWLIFRMPF